MSASERTLPARAAAPRPEAPGCAEAGAAAGAEGAAYGWTGLEGGSAQRQVAEAWLLHSRMAYRFACHKSHAMGPVDSVVILSCCPAGEEAELL